MSTLPIFRGTPAQVKWATAIRLNALKSPTHAPHGDQLVRIDDATWWIANRDRDCPDTLDWPYKAPAPHQLVGGPPPPAKAAERGQGLLGEPRPENPEDEPHDAELFAASASHIPILAELAIMATLSRLYKGEQGKVFRQRTLLRLERLREYLIEDIDRDIKGIRRILGEK